MIEFKKVSFAYEDKPVIENFDLLIPDGKVTAVMGLSGLGKTTVMKLAIGLLTPQDGEIIRDYASASYLFQENRLFETSVINNLLMVGIPREKAIDLLQKFDLQKDIDTPVDKLSGGMARRVAIARMLGVESEMYFIDETIKELDEHHRNKALELIREYTKNKTVMLITHDLEEAEYLNAKIISLN